MAVNGESDDRLKNSFYWEEASVQLSGANEDWKTFKQHCTGLRESVWAAWECKKNDEKINSSTFASHLIAIKELNRRTQFRIRKARDRTTEQKMGVDKLHLSLQNFLYEVAHLENEIKTCLDFKSQHEKLNLIPVEEFCQATGRDPETASTHEGTLERLYWENEQRKKLSTALDHLQEAVQVTEREIQQKRDYLASFGPKLKELSENTIATQEAMNLPFTKEERQYKLAYLLPSPLYVLYAHLKSYLSVTDDLLQVTVEIEGDAQLARAVNQSVEGRSTLSALGTVAPDADDSDADLEAPTQKKRKTGRHKSKSQDTPDRHGTSTILATHPLSVVVKLVHEYDIAASSKSRFELQLTFYWALTLKLVTVRLQVTPPTDQSLSSSSGSDLLSSEQLLCNLDWTSNPTSGLTRGSDWPILPTGCTEQQWDACQSIGRPFLWAQELCGSHCLLEANPPVDDSTVSALILADSDFGQVPRSTKPRPHLGRIDTWLAALKGRLNDRILLIQELVHIEAERPMLSTEQQTLLPPLTAGRSGGVKLTNWRRATFTNLKNVSRAQVPVSLNLIQPEDAIFQCEFRQGDSQCATVWAAVPPEYPHKPPLLVIETITMGSKSTGKSSGTAIPDLIFMDLEAELNCYWNEFFVDRGLVANESSTHECSKSNILSCQLARCASCLEALWKDCPVPSRSGDQTIGGYCVKYPTRGPPLRYLPSLGVHTHR